MDNYRNEYRIFFLDFFASLNWGYSQSGSIIDWRKVSPFNVWPAGRTFKMAIPFGFQNSITKILETYYLSLYLLELLHLQESIDNHMEYDKRTNSHLRLLYTANEVFSGFVKWSKFVYNIQLFAFSEGLTNNAEPNEVSCICTSSGELMSIVL